MKAKISGAVKREQALIKTLDDNGLCRSDIEWQILDNMNKPIKKLEEKPSAQNLTARRVSVKQEPFEESSLRKEKPTLTDIVC